VNKIKFIIIIIFLCSVSLIILSSSINQSHQLNNKFLDTVNKQKAFTQEISKNIFYIYRNKEISASQLNNLIKKFIKNINTNKQLENDLKSDNIKEQNKKIILLWNDFYLKVQKFRNLNKISTAYSNIILEKIVKDIYNLNLKLIVEFDKLIEIRQKEFQESIKTKKTIQYLLYILILLLLIYLFTQLKTTISFIQKFLNTSKNIITNSTIKELKPIELHSTSNDVLQATNNFNFLVQEINNSIENSSKSMQHSYDSIELIEKNIEQLLELFYEMQEDEKFDKEMTKKEDILIQSLEELTKSSKKLQDLKTDLDNLIS